MAHYKKTATGLEYSTDSGELELTDCASTPNSTKFIEPYPPFWILKDGILTLTETPEPDSNKFVKPYPPSLPYISNGELCYGIEPMNIGAFNKCCFCGEVVIPKSVKLIGSHAFANSGIKSVVISQDCTYFDTSFPKDCEIIKV